MTRTVLVTRHADDCRELEALLSPCGIAVLPYPVLRLAEVDDADGLTAAVAAVSAPSGELAWLLLASPRAAPRIAHRARARDARRLLDLPTAAVGEATARAASGAGLRVELVGPGTGLGLADALLERLAPRAPVVFACGRHRRDELPERLEAAGHPVLPVVLYAMERTPAAELPAPPAAVDAVILTSPRSARFYLDGMAGEPLGCTHWALGPTTRDAAAALGITCRIPPRPNLESLAEELCTT